MEEIMRKLPHAHADMFRRLFKQIENAESDDMKSRIGCYVRGYAWALHNQGLLTLDEYDEVTNPARYFVEVA